jgi:hypothetical protein
MESQRRYQSVFTSVMIGFNEILTTKQDFKLIKHESKEDSRLA